MISCVEEDEESPGDAELEGAEGFVCIAAGGVGETEREVADETPWPEGVLEAAWRFGAIMCENSRRGS